MCACGGVMNGGKSMMVAWLELLGASVCGVGVWVAREMHKEEMAEF